MKYSFYFLRFYLPFAVNNYKASRLFTTIYVLIGIIIIFSYINEFIKMIGNYTDEKIYRSMSNNTIERNTIFIEVRY